MACTCGAMRPGNRSGRLRARLWRLPAPPRRKCPQDLLRLALAYGPGGLSLRQAAAWAQAHGVAVLSDVALLKRLSRAAEWLAPPARGPPGRAGPPNPG